MRDIVFRGKIKDNGSWTYGSLIVIDETYIIVKYDDPNCFISRYGFETDNSNIVDKETVGQYTGIVDKKNEFIFEGDIVKNSKGMVGKIVYIQSFCGFCIVDDERLSSLDDTCIDIEVIGNIFDK